MNLLATAPGGLLWVLIALLAAAAAQDAVQLRISNPITVSVVAAAIVAAIVSWPEITLWQNCLVFALILSAGAFLFERSVLGGGDVKLFAAVGLWVDFSAAARLVVAILLCGGLLALIILLLRVIAPAPAAGRVAILRPRSGIPYGIAIAAGTIMVTAVTRMGMNPG